MLSEFRVGVERARVAVQFRDVSFEAEVLVGSAGLPSVSNTFKSWAQVTQNLPPCSHSAADVVKGCGRCCHGNCRVHVRIPVVRSGMRIWALQFTDVTADSYTCNTAGVTYIASFVLLFCRALACWLEKDLKKSGR